MGKGAKARREAAQGERREQAAIVAQGACNADGRLPGSESTHARRGAGSSAGEESLPFAAPVQRDFVEYMHLDESEVQGEIERFTRCIGQDFIRYRGEAPQGRPIPDYRYVIATTARTGSTYLGRVLHQLGMGLPGEYFNLYSPAELTFQESLARFFIQGRLDGGAVGWKMSISDLLPFLQLNNFPLGLHGWKWVFVTRTNVLAQAISLYVAKVTDRWISTGEWSQGQGIREPAEVPYDSEAINQELLYILEENRRWEAFFSYNGITPLRVTYEEVDDDVLACAGRIRRHLGMEQADILPSVRVVKQRNSANDALVAKFLEVSKGNLQGTDRHVFALHRALSSQLPDVLEAREAVRQGRRAMLEAQREAEAARQALAEAEAVGKQLASQVSAAQEAQAGLEVRLATALSEADELKQRLEANAEAQQRASLAQEALETAKRHLEHECRGRAAAEAKLREERDLYGLLIEEANTERLLRNSIEEQLEREASRIADLERQLCDEREEKEGIQSLLAAEVADKERLKIGHDRYVLLRSYVPRSLRASIAAPFKLAGRFGRRAP